MAIVQLVYLLRDPSSPASDFWLYEQNNPGLIKAQSLSLNAMKAMKGAEWRDVAKWAAITKASSWPQEGSFVDRPAELGIPINVAFALSVNDSGEAAADQQPNSRYWLVHRSEGKILAVRNKLSDATKRLESYLADQTQF